MDDFFKQLIAAPGYVQAVILIAVILICRFGPRNLFSFSGRMSRSSYIACVICLFVIGLITIFTFGFYARNNSDLLFAIAGSLYFIVNIINLSLVSRRLRDIGFSPWWLVVLIIVGVAITSTTGSEDLFSRATDALTVILLIIPGTKGPNKYGPDPLASTEEK